MDKNYALLDYDGYICKAWYAAVSKDDPDSYDRILSELVELATEKAKKFFESEEVIVLRVMSGHSWKKDVYDTYKATRKKDPYIGLIREGIKATDNEVIVPEHLEADEWVLLLHKYIPNSIVFSDDKDLHYLSRYFCRLNVTEEVQTNDPNNKFEEFFEQLLAGDNVDNIKGVPKVGMKTARKLLGDEHNFKHVIEIYRDKNIDKEECIKNISLVTPTGFFNESELCEDIITEYIEARDYTHIPNVEDIIIKDTQEMIKDEVEDIYPEIVIWQGKEIEI